MSSNKVLTKFTHILFDIYQKFLHHGHSGEISIKKIIIETLHNTIDHVFSLYKNELLIVATEYNIDFEIETQEKKLKNKVDKVLDDKIKENDILDMKVDKNVAKIIRDTFQTIGNSIFDGIDVSDIPQKIRAFKKDNPHASQKKINKYAKSLLENICNTILSNFIKNISNHIMDETIDIAADKITDSTVALIDVAKVKIEEKLDGPSETIALALMDIVRDNVDDVIDAGANELKEKIKEKIDEKKDAKDEKKEVDLKSKIKSKDFEYTSADSPDSSLTPNSHNSLNTPNSTTVHNNSNSNHSDVDHDPHFVSELLHKLSNKVEDTIETIEDKIDIITDNIKDKIKESEESKKIKNMAEQIEELSRFKDEEDFMEEIEKLSKILKEMNARFNIGDR